MGRRPFQRPLVAPALLMLLGASLLGGGGAHAQGLPFLRYAPDAEGGAMGGAYSALADGPFAHEWNPAGFAADVGNSAGGSVQSWIGDTRTLALSARLAAGAAGGVGLFVTATTAGEVGDADVLDGVGDEQGQYFALGGAYARRLGPLRLGAAASYLYEERLGVSASGFAVDVGAQAATADGALRLGAAVQHVGDAGDVGADATSLPTVVRGGVAVAPFRLATAFDDATLLSTVLAVEVVVGLEDVTGTEVRVGGAAVLFDLLSVRVGYVGGDTATSVTGGLGVEVSDFTVDYAVAPFDAGFGGTGQTVSVRYGW